MNTAFNSVLALSAAGLSLLSLAGQAGAQTTISNPSLALAFSDYNGKGQPGYTTTAIGVGFDGATGGGHFLPQDTTQTTAQSVYESFVFDSSAAGTFSTIAAGSTAQVQLYASNNNVNSGSNFDIYTSLYAYNPNAAAGTVPVMGPDLFGPQQKVVLGIQNTGYFTSDFTTTGAIVAGQSYVLGFTTLNSDTQDYGQVASTVINGQSGLATADATFDANKYLTDIDDQGVPTATYLDQTNAADIAFKLYTAPAAVAAAPEPSQTAALGLFIAGLGGLIVIKRRHAAA